MTCPPLFISSSCRQKWCWVEERNGDSMTIIPVRSIRYKTMKLRNTSSNASKMSMLGWWMVQTTVRPVSTVFLTVHITTAAALASRPVVGSSMKRMEGLATNSTATVSLFLCSVESPCIPGRPTKASLRGWSSIKSITSSTNTYATEGTKKQLMNIAYKRVN